MQRNPIKIAELVKSKKAILINTKFIKSVLGFDDMRDFAKSIGDWGFATDFTYRNYQLENWQLFLRKILAGKVLRLTF
jgi:hypothetical protein